MASARPLRVLTVGDGDLTYSRALLRAYGSRLSLTASVLVTAEELRETYAFADACLAELFLSGVPVLHEVDATALPPAELQWDHIVKREEVQVQRDSGHGCNVGVIP